MVELIGTVGSICFAISGIPAAYDAIKNRYCNYSWAFLGLWLIGEVLCSWYVLMKGVAALFYWNYLPNLACLLILICFNRVTRPKKSQTLHLVHPNSHDAP